MQKPRYPKPGNVFAEAKVMIKIPLEQQGSRLILAHGQRAETRHRKPDAHASQLQMLMTARARKMLPQSIRKCATVRLQRVAAFTCLHSACSPRREASVLGEDLRT